MIDKKCCVVCNIACLLVFLGALNWGLVGAFNFNVVEFLLATHPRVIRLVYIVIGATALLKLFSCFIPCPCCKKGSCEKPTP